MSRIASKSFTSGSSHKSSTSRPPDRIAYRSLARGRTFRQIPPKSPQLLPHLGKRKRSQRTVNHVRPREGRRRSTFHSSSAVNKCGVQRICCTTRSFDSTEGTWPQMDQLSEQQIESATKRKNGTLGAWRTERKCSASSLAEV